MKHIRLSALFAGVFLLSALAAQAAQLASAKVVNVTGVVSKYTAEGEESPLVAGDILTEGHSIMTSVTSSADLVFSNGSELTVEPKSSVTIKELSQKPFKGNKSYEQLSADPSESQALLELNYGKVDGHVKKLKKGSRFDLETPLGTAAIRGTRFFVSLRYNVETGDMIMKIKNVDGLVELLSRYAGSIEYGRGSVGEKPFDPTMTSEKLAQLPPAHTVVVRLNKNSPYFDDLFNRILNFAPSDEQPPIIEGLPVSNNVNPDDDAFILFPDNEVGGTDTISPSGPGL